MTITSKIKKRKNAQGLNKLKKYLREISGAKVEVGFLGNETYDHPRNTEGWSYAEMMGFHELAVDFTERRKIFKQTSISHKKDIANFAKDILIKDLKTSLIRPIRKPDKALDEIGFHIKSKIENTFGKVTPLVPPNKYATIKQKGHGKPMVEDGTLMKGLGVRNTISKSIKKTR